MGHKKIPGLQKRFGVWQIDKKICGIRVCESTGTSDLEEAEKVLARRIDEMRQAKFFGARPKRTFREAALRYIREKQDKATIKEDVRQLQYLVPYLGDLDLNAIHMGALQSFIEKRQKEVKTTTVNRTLEVIRHLLNLAASEWIDDNGLTWLQTSPKIKTLKELDKRKPYPISWEEQERLFNMLPKHLKEMALFAVNTGCRDAEICNLRWDWETKIDNHSVFVIPAPFVKNREDRLVVLNHTAQSIIESKRGQHASCVFTYHGKPIKRMNNSAWQNAREKVGFPHVRVHDLKHTFGRRLRAAGVSFEDRQDLLGHKSGRITTHYCSAELEHLIDAANKVCEKRESGLLLRIISRQESKIAQQSSTGSRESHERHLQIVR